MALLVKGWASTSAIDAEDHSFGPDAIRWGIGTPPIELLYRHRPAEPCGKIRSLSRRATPDGGVGLWCEASVDPSFAKAPFTGFSVRTKIETYTIKRIPKPYAVVTSAVLIEVSLVPVPCNPECLILEREEWSEVTPHLLESINKARSLQRLIETAMRAHG